MVLLENLDLPTVEIPAPVFSAQIRCFAHTLETFGQYGLETDHESLAPARLDQIHQLTVLGHIQCALRDPPDLQRDERAQQLAFFRRS